MGWIITRIILMLLSVLLAEGSITGGLLYTYLYSDSYEPPAITVSIDDGTATRFADMEYIRPDYDAIAAMVEEITALAQEKDTDAVLDAIAAFYDAYDRIMTSVSLADIYYSRDLTSSKWEEENSYCTQILPQLRQLKEKMYLELAASPCRKALERDAYGSGFFESYDDGESFWDDRMVELSSREGELISQYYAQSGEAGDNLWDYFFSDPEPMVQTLVDLIQVRNEIAAYQGYDSYEAYANDIGYYRDYEPEDMTAYLESIRTELVPLFRTLNESYVILPDAREAESYSYVRDAAQKMGGTVWEAFRLLEGAGLYDIAYSRNKFDSSFELFLDFYGEPFLFVNPERTEYDRLTISHEFGHFCNDYACGTGSVSIDVAEIFSQAMEYLLLFYGEDTALLTRAKMIDSLNTYVEQACYARFEQEMYRIPADELSVQSLCDLYEETALAYGFDAIGYERTEFVTITHFYTMPMYVTSYIISNDAAMQFYQLELEQAGQGLAVYQKNLAVWEPYFLRFLEITGLESPFAPGRLTEVRQLFTDVLAA